MNVNINKSTAAKALKAFSRARGFDLKQADALELLASMCGFSTYRAMAACEKEQPVADKDPVQVIPLLDWLFAEEPGSEDITPERQRPYQARIKTSGNCLQVMVLPEGVSEEAFPGQNVLNLFVEINGGVPAVSVGNDPEDNALTIFSTKDGLFVRNEHAEWSVSVPEEGTELATIVETHGKVYVGDILSHKTGEYA